MKNAETQEANVVKRALGAAAPAVAALALVSTWASDASANTGATSNSSLTLTVNGSVTVGLTNAVSFISNGLTILDRSTGLSLGDISAGQFGPITRDHAHGGRLTGIRQHASFAAVIDNSDGTSDLVLAFRGDGSAAVGVAWTSLFVNNLPDEQQVFEPQVIAQLMSNPVFDAKGMVEPGSQLDRMDEYYRDLLNSEFGETATLIAFRGPGNTGEIVGSITIIPSTGTLALAALGAIPVIRRRRA